MAKQGGYILELTAVIVAVTDEVPRIITVKTPELKGLSTIESVALPFGPFDPEAHRTLELALRTWVTEQAGMELGYVEQLYTFGNQNRDPRELIGGQRVVSIAYLALTRESKSNSEGKAIWGNWYRFFPWEDWREGKPEILDLQIIPALKSWLKGITDSSFRRAQQERADIAFGLSGMKWDTERVLHRFELLYEAAFVEEKKRDILFSKSSARKRKEDKGKSQYDSQIFGLSMALDHRRILASALGRLRGKLQYRPLVFELLPSTFTLYQLQRLVEALAGVKVHKQNFRRLVEQGGLVEATGTSTTKTGGRPAQLFRFRREVLKERSAAGVGLPRR